MNQTSEDFSKAGRVLAETGLSSLASLSKNAQAIAVEAGEYTRDSLEAGGAAFEAMLAAKSLEKALEIQSGYAKRSYQGFVAETARLGELYAELARDAYKPFETIIARPK